MNFLDNIKIKNKLIFPYVLIVAIPILIIGYFLTNKLYLMSFSSTRQLSEVTVNQLRGNFLVRLATHKEVIDTLINYDPFNQYLSTYYEEDYAALYDYQLMIDPLINRLTGKYDNVLIKVYTNNNTIGFSGVTNNMLSDIGRQNWYDPSPEARHIIKWVKSNNITGGYWNKYIGCYKTLMDYYDRNRVNAVIAVFLEEHQLYSLISEEHAGGKVIFLCDDDNEIITTTERDMLEGSISNLKFDNGKTIDSIESDSIIRYKGKDYLFISRNISNTDLYINNWRIIYMVPASGILYGIRNILMSSIILCLVCLVFALAVILFISQNITRRILNLVSKINKVKEGNFKVPAGVSGNDEITVIETNFNDMVERIDKLINEVYEANIRIRDVEIKNQKIQMEKKEAEIIALQGQINPHYLFNTLETVRMNLILKDDRETAQIVKVFSESFRSSIECRREIYTMREELKFIENYFVIQKYRFRDKVSYMAKVPDHILDYYIPKLIIQPLIENAMYHGIEMKLGNGTIKLDAYEKDDELHILVSDDGVGIEEDELEKIKSHIYSNNNDYKGWTRIALKNVHNRLSLMYGDRYGLKISSKKNSGTVVGLILPVCKTNRYEQPREV